MLGRKRLLAALALVVLCAPGTWLRTEVSKAMPRNIALEQVSGAKVGDTPGWEVGGVWRYSSPVATRNFGGYSALLALGGNRLRAFSDRGTRFTFIEPDQPRESADQRVVSFQLVEPEYAYDLWDIESATRDPVSGDYWLGYEAVHAIHRFSIASDAKGVRELGDVIDWYVNGGAEAMVRLNDGRFLIIGEGKSEALIFSGDPVEGAEIERFTFETPAQSYAVTDMAQLPDGRVILLMRNVEFGFPPFAGLLAIAAPPASGSDAPWRPEVVLRFEGNIPAENYEGMAVRALADGRVAVWVIADDNLSVLQRSLLVKLIYDPNAEL